MHKLLLQIQRILEGQEVPPHLRPLLEAVSQTYAEGDADRALLERSLDLTSQELLQRNQDLRSSSDRAIAASQARLAEAQAIARLGSWESDPATGNEVWSDEQFRLLGLEPRSCAPSRTARLERVHPDDRSTLERRLEEALRGNAPGMEYRVLRADEAVRWLADTWRVERDAAGRPVRLVGTSQDLTDRRLAEAARRESDERLREFAERARQVFWTFTPDFGKVLYTSPSYRDFFGRDPALLQKDPVDWLNAIVPEDRPLVLATMRQAMADLPPEGLAVQYRVLRPDGSQAWFRSEGYAVRDAEGRLLRITGVTSDITALKRTEAFLREAMQAAEAAAKAKGEFLANMSHEIRTPMNAVIGMTALLLETCLDREQQEMAGTIRASGDHLMTVINDILDFSKIESGKLELERLPVPVRQLVEDCLKLVGPRAREKGLLLGCALDPQVPATVEGDPARLRQVLLNLLSNAVKFTPEGSIQVRVRARRRGSGLHDVEFAVQDTGIGIPADRLERLFESFSQVDASTTRAYGGTGLGLAITKRLAQAMGGRVWAESEQGKGSVFHATVCLPEAPAAPPPAPPAPRDLPAQPAGLAILLAEDNPTNRQVALRMLERLGYRADVATNGEEAVRAAHARRYDVVFMDVQMPVLDGVEATRRIHADRPTDGPAIIAMTAHAMPGDRERYLAAGMDDYIAKPVRLETLAGVLAAQNPQTA